MNLTYSPALEKPRLSSIDLVRGLVMVIMALDHTRDFFHTDAMLYNPTDLSKTTPVLFFTRWITHFCAPTFVLLAGTSIYISLKNKTRHEMINFLLTRGFWLILLEITIIRFALLFNFYYDITFLQVIWVIGASMVVMALVIRLPFYVVLATSLVILFGHNLLQNIQPDAGHPLSFLWSILFRMNQIQLTDSSSIFVMYPLIPWLGIMMLGYCLGKWYRPEYNLLRPTYLTIAGIGMILLFIVIRYSNIYGNTTPWQPQSSFLFTVMSFLNCEKYPPSLCFVLMTIGPVFVLLGLLEKVKSRALTPLLIFGRVPLFYYILHFFLIHLFALLFFTFKTGKSLTEINFHFSSSFGGITAEGGYSLGLVYLAWICIVVLLYPVCHWYAGFKHSRKQWWLSYI